MKKIIGISLLLFSLTACTTNDKTSNPVENNITEKSVLTQSEITGILNNWLNLWATYDLNLLPDIFLQSDKLTYFSTEKKGVIKGYKQMYPHHKSFGFAEGGAQPKITLWLEDIQPRIYGETAVVTAIWYDTAYGAPKETAKNGPVTFVLVRDDQGNVRIANASFADYK
jgi:hypothetical protein